MRCFVCSAIFIALGFAASAAPLTVKEIDFLLRQKTPEAEILNQLKDRRMLAPIDPIGEQQLAGKGASPRLLQILKEGAFLLSAEEAAIAQQRRTPPPAPALPAAPDSRAAAVSAALSPDHIVRQLQGNLLTLQGDELKPMDAQALSHVRLFAFYNSAQWCGPCRAFTPRLIEAYKQLKAAHPDFEIIFLSSDRDAFNMANYMRTSRMPWPAMRLGTESALKSQYCAQSVPWLVCVDRTGRALTTNGVDKKYLNPDEVVQAIAYLLAQAK